MQNLENHDLFQTIPLNRIQEGGLYAFLKEALIVNQCDMGVLRQLLLDVFLNASSKEFKDPCTIQLTNSGVNFGKDPIYVKLETGFYKIVDKNTNMVKLSETAQVFSQANLFLTPRQLLTLFLFAGLCDFQRTNQEHFLHDVQSFLNKSFNNESMVYSHCPFRVDFHSILELFDTPSSLRLPTKVKEILLELRAGNLEFSLRGGYNFEKKRCVFRPTIPLKSVCVEEQRYSARDVVFVEVRISRVEFPRFIHVVDQLKETGVKEKGIIKNRENLDVGEGVYKKAVFRVVRNTIAETIGTPMTICKNYFS
jgi:hypothetical protein